MLWFINDMNKVVKQFGKKSMVYNGFEHLGAREQGLDRDIIITAWESSALRREGNVPYEIVNNVFTQGLYLTPNIVHNLWLDPKHLYKNWNPAATSHRGVKQLGIAIGMWADANFWAADEMFERHLERGRAASADRMWNHERPGDTVNNFYQRLARVGGPPGFVGFQPRTRVDDGKPSLHYTFDKTTTWPAGYHDASRPGTISRLEEKIQNLHGVTGHWGNISVHEEAIEGESWGLHDDKAVVQYGRVSIDPPWTVSVWVKRIAHRKNARIFSARDPITGECSYVHIEHDHQRVALTDLSGKNYQFNYSIPINTWTHLVLVADSSSTELYVNGAFLGRESVSMALPLESIGTICGTKKEVAPRALLDEMKIYDEALNSTQVAGLYTTYCTAKLLHHWTFDETSGRTAANAGSSGASGDVTGATWVSGGQIGRALSFDGSGDFVHIGASTIFPGVPRCRDAWTAALWVKRTGDTSESVLFDTLDGPSGGTGWRVKLEQYNNTREVGVSKRHVGDFRFGYTTPLNQWVHLVLVGTTRGTRLYVNGVLHEQMISQVVDLPVHRIGHGVSGVLDDVRIYRGELSQAEITALATPTSSLVDSSAAKGLSDEGDADPEDRPERYVVDPEVVASVQALAAQVHHGEAHVNRWERVLVAFGLLDGEAVAGGAMTAAEAELMAGIHSSPTWRLVAIELAALEAARKEEQDETYP